MSTYTCPLAEGIGHTYSLAPEQVSPAKLRSLAQSWRPGGRNLLAELTSLADDLAAELTAIGLPQEGPVSNEDGHALARSAMSGNPGCASLLAELEAGWARSRKD